MPKILNNFLCSVMIFALSFLWVYYCVKSVAWALTLGLILAFCSAYLIARIQNKVGQVKAVKQQNKKVVANFYDYLKYNENNAELFAELYRYYHYDVDIVDYDSFIAVKDNSRYYVATLYAKDSLNASDIATAIVQAKRAKTDKLRVYVGKADAVISKTAKQRFDVEFVDVNNAYELLSQADKLPTIPQVKPAKNSFIAKYAFCRKRFGWYFASSVFMALVSVVAYFPYYTLAWATVMLVLALYSLFNTRYNTRQTNVTLN